MVRAERKAKAVARRPPKGTRNVNRDAAMKIALDAMPVTSKLLARVKGVLELGASLNQSIAAAASRVRPPHFVPRLTLRVSAAATNAKSVLQCGIASFEPSYNMYRFPSGVRGSHSVCLNKADALLVYDANKLLLADPELHAACGIIIAACVATQPRHSCFYRAS